MRVRAVFLLRHADSETDKEGITRRNLRFLNNFYNNSCIEEAAFTA